MIARIFLSLISAFALSCEHPNNFKYLVPDPAPQKKVPIGPPGKLFGLVTNSTDGHPLGGVSVTLHAGGASGQVEQTTNTDGDGAYAFPRLAAGDYAVDFTLRGYIPIMGAPTTIHAGQDSNLGESMTTILAAHQYRIVMNWTGPIDGGVRDVDSYLQTPGFETDPVCYHNQPGYRQGANLDHDYTAWWGPETVTITDLRQGVYTYYVNNYNMKCLPTSLSNSNVNVRVYQGAQLLKTYTIPTNQIGITFEFFQIIDGQIHDVMQWADYLQTYGGASSCVP